MLKYHVKITDNETGEVITDNNYNCLIGAFGHNDGASEMAICDCEILSIVGTVEAALKAVERICKSDPAIEYVVEYMLKEGGVFKDE